MRRLVTISYTGLNAGGGVPAFNRALHAAFPDRECVHFCWESINVPANYHSPEFGKARALNNYLLASRKISPNDIVIADGFWADGLSHFPFAISHSHGIWGHVTKADADAGKQPENELLHNAQITFRKRWCELGKPLTAVSKFIANQMRFQWGFESTVINNGVDTNVWKPPPKRPLMREGSRPGIAYIVHGVNDKGNVNKGWDHIEAIKSYWAFRSDRPVQIESLDDFARKTGLNKQDALAQADLVVHPSGFEGNSMFILEALACGAPVIAYDVGYLYDFGISDLKYDCGEIMPLPERSPERTLQAVNRFLSLSQGQKDECSRWARLMTNGIEQFNVDWRNYVERLENAK